MMICNDHEGKNRSFFHSNHLSAPLSLSLSFSLFVHLSLCVCVLVCIVCVCVYPGGGGAVQSGWSYLLEL